MGTRRPSVKVIALRFCFNACWIIATFCNAVAKASAFHYVSIKKARSDERNSVSLPSNPVQKGDNLSRTKGPLTGSRKLTSTSSRVSLFDFHEVLPVEDDDAAFSQGFIFSVIKSEIFHWFLGSLLVAIAYVAILRSPISYDTLLESYKASMIRNPVRTKVATGATLAVLGDALAQMREPGAYSRQRAISFALFDSCYRMFQHVAFPTVVGLCQGRFLGSIISTTFPRLSVGTGTGLLQFLATTERTLMYQLGVVPLFYYPVFFTFTGLLQGLSMKQTFERAKSNFFPCWRRNLMFWIPIQMIMFGLIDEKWQIPFVCIMGMIWSTILSVTAGKAKK